MSKYTLKVSNFQIIKNAEIELRQGLTLIQGHSNHGKSSLFKALKQLVYNTSGTDYIRHNSTGTTISLSYFENDAMVYNIEYYKSKTKSQYTVTTSQGTNVYQKLGSSQPEFIKDITQIDKSYDYNFWNQLEKPFLIGLTPREQFDILQNSPHSKVLTDCLSTMVQDRKSYQTQETQLQAKLELIQHQSTSYKEQLKSLPKVSNLFTKITKLKDTHTLLNDLNLKFTRLSHLTQEITPLQSKLQSLSTLPDLTHLTTLHTNIQTLQSQYHKLQQTVYPINELQNTISNLQTQYDQITCFLQTHFPNCPLCNRPFHNSN